MDKCIIRLKTGSNQHTLKNGKKVDIPIFEYKYNTGKKVILESTMERINKLRIPPMWEDVEISASDTEYLQVTGKDAKGRTQYIYHPLFVTLTDTEKYSRLGKFCKKLPLLEKKVSEDFSVPNLENRDYIIALMFKIMMKTHSRIGNDCYADDNNTFGLTTLTKKHMTIENSNVVFDFIGKKSVRQILSFKDNKIADALNKLKKIPGNRLFMTKTGQIIKSNDMNDYLRDVIGEEFSCKDFRTYASNLLFIQKLCEIPTIPTTKKETETNIKNTYDSVAEELGHTRAISKSSYVMPLLAEKYLENPMIFYGQKNSKKLIKSLIF